MEEKWLQWIPFKGAEYTKYIESLNYTYDGVEIILFLEFSDSKLTEKVSLKFNIEYASICDERSKLMLLKCLYSNYPEDFFSKGRLFFIENSKLIKYLEKESGGIMKSFELKHYVLMDDDDVFDIISHGEPEVKIMKK